MTQVEKLQLEGFNWTLEIPPTLTPEDFQRGEAFRKQDLVDLKEPNALFMAARFALLSAAQDYQTHRRLDRQFTEAGLNSDAEIIRRMGFVEYIMQGANHRNNKTKHLEGMARWWLGSDLPNQIIFDSECGFKREFQLRDQLANEVPGLGYKCASYFLYKCGAENLAILDRHMVIFLHKSGLDVRIPDYTRVSGPNKYTYPPLERAFQEIAKDYGVTPAVLHATVWVRSLLST